MGIELGIGGHMPIVGTWKMVGGCRGKHPHCSWSIDKGAGGLVPPFLCIKLLSSCGS